MGRQENMNFGYGGGEFPAPSQITDSAALRAVIIFIRHV